MQREAFHLPTGFVIRSPDGGRYTVEALLGQGGFSAVYRVREQQGQQRVFALKEVLDLKWRERERLLFEAELLQKLSHRALPRVYSAFENPDLKRVYILMNYIEGYNLEALRKGQPEQRISLPLVLTLMEPVVDALDYLHGQTPPIVHRDLKPANILVPLGRDETILVDFSIAKRYIPDGDTTTIRYGSPGYASPEQYGGGTSPLTDIYGLGATFYTLLTGTVPPDAIIRLTTRKGVEPLQPAHLLVPTIPLAISEALQRALSTNSEDRFSTVKEFWCEVSAEANEMKAPPSAITALSLESNVLSPEKIVVSSTVTPIPGPQSALFQKRRINALAFLLLLALILGLFSFVHLPASSPTLRPARAAHPSPSIAITPSHSVPATSPFPLLSAAYRGKAGDLSAHTKTDMFLTNVQQDQGTIHGFFQGLGQSGYFNGTIDTAGHIQFTVSVYNGSATLVFDGAIKLGGDLAGSYTVLNHNGQPTGETGLWSVSSTSTD